MPLEVYPIKVYGEMYQYNDPTPNIIIINTSGVWEIIDGMTGSLVNEVVFQNSQELKILVEGTYKIDFNLCWTDGVGNVYEFVIFVNGVLQINSVACGRKGNAVDIVTANGSGIIDLNEDDIITLKVRNRTTANDIEIISANLNLTKRGLSQ